jgi:hypothetical protein
VISIVSRPEIALSISFTDDRWTVGVTVGLLASDAACASLSLLMETISVINSPHLTTHDARTTARNAVDTLRQHMRDKGEIE